mmetsp:Transcript_6325/g.7249  ORF Transcript_6325/g.7249 Transcript_6325/m.7249 type:complete len:199 (+) Transcript_6325:341-937(+)
MKSNTVSSEALAAIVISPLLVATMTEIFLSRLTLASENFVKSDLHAFCLSYFEALSINFTLTQLTKIGSGRLRPDYLARLASGDSSAEAEGHLSFCSGHASFSFVAMVIVALFLSGKTKVFSQPKNAFPKFLLVVMLPITLAGFVAISRTRDYWHDFSDINAGALIGTFSSVSAYFLNYPSLSSSKSNVPKVILETDI